eukprot:5792056-Lingulodinium_polyedra.AAC.1
MGGLVGWVVAGAAAGASAALARGARAAGRRPAWAASGKWGRRGRHGGALSPYGAGPCRAPRSR